MAFLKRFNREYLLAVLILFIGLAATLDITVSFQNARQQTMMEQFTQKGRERIHLITNEIENNNILLRSLTAFFLSSEEIDRNKFTLFAEQILQDHPYIQAIQWMPFVPAAERLHYERDICIPGTEIRDEDGQGRLVSAADRDSYYPICYIAPIDDNREVLGFDFMANKQRGDAARYAISSHAVSATARVSLLQTMDTAKEQAGVIFVAPVIPAENARPSGLLATVVPLSHLIESAIAPLDHAGMNLLIHDVTEDGGEELVYAQPTRLRDASESDILADYQSAGPYLLQDTVAVGGRTWRISVIPARGFFRQTIARESVFLFIGGLAFTILIGVYLVSRIRESDRIADEVAERTSELAAAQRQTEMILLSTREGIAGFDAEGKISFCNPMSARLLGYKRKELIGKDHHALIHHSKADGSPYDIAACPIQKILEDGQPCTVGDEVFWRKDGTMMEVEYTGAPIIDGAVITGAVLVFRDIAERKAIARQMEQMARFDQLTGLPNRAHFMESIRTALARAERSGTIVGIVYMDLNGFKPVNDTLGHAAGDLLLKSFAERLRKVVRESDLPARLGGDEFTVLADSLGSQDECFALIARIRQVLEEPFTVAGRRFSISASIGVSFYPDHAGNIDDLISCADSAMYAAKKDKDAPYITFRPG